MNQGNSHGHGIDLVKLTDDPNLDTCELHQSSSKSNSIQLVLNNNNIYGSEHMIVES